MILDKLSIINYKNLASVTLDLSPKINCFIGHNGAGKTNVLDAVYYLSFCRSAQTSIDSQVIRHHQDFFVIEGNYLADSDSDAENVCVSDVDTVSASASGADTTSTSDLDADVRNGETIYCGMKRGTKKQFKRNKKVYKRLSEHIGMIPLVMVSPSDNMLIEGGSEERRRLIDMVISQYDRSYMESLMRYNKALQQRNTLLKLEMEPDPDVMAIWEEQMAAEGEQIYAKRKEFIEEFVPIFQEFYREISVERETVGLTYVSHCQRGPLLEVIQRDRAKDRIMGFSLHGVHRDDLEFMLGDHLMKREGSQGQNKTFVVALKLAQFEFLKRTARKTLPILLLDDIFDKLDATRVEQIVRLVAGDRFGQIFITDTNRDHLDEILSKCSHDYKLFEVENGEVGHRD